MRARTKPARASSSLLDYFGDKTLADISGELCRAYVRHRGNQAAARRELEQLRAAINHHHREGLCSVKVAIPMPARLRGARAMAHAQRGGAPDLVGLALSRGSKGTCDRAPFAGSM